MITKDAACILIYQQWLNFTLIKGHLTIILRNRAEYRLIFSR